MSREVLVSTASAEACRTAGGDIRGITIGGAFVTGAGYMNTSDSSPEAIPTSHPVLGSASAGRCQSDRLRSGQPGTRPPARPTGLGPAGLHRGVARGAQGTHETQCVQIGAVTAERAGSPGIRARGIWTTASSATEGLGAR
jgi:hypothetical protein